MKSEQVNTEKSKIAIIKNLPKPIKILLAVFIGIIVLVLLLRIGGFVYCHTVAICDSRPTMSPEIIATQVSSQYKLAIQDINAGRYEIAKQRLEYILYNSPNYSGAKEKLYEVEKMLRLTPTP